MKRIPAYTTILMVLLASLGGVLGGLWISKLMFELKKQGDTILFIEHDMQFTIQIADKIVVMDSGRVIAQGAPKDIKKNPKVLEAYLGQ